MFLLAFNILLLIFINKKKAVQNHKFLICGISIIILHSYCLLAVHNTGVAGSDTIFYYKNAIDFFYGSQSFADLLALKLKYVGYIFQNIAFTYPLTGINEVVDLIFIRLNNYILWFATITLVLSSIRGTAFYKLYTFLFHIIAVWYSLYNLRDGTISIIILLMVYWGFKNKFAVVILGIILLFYREEVIGILLLSSIIVLFAKKLSYFFKRKYVALLVFIGVALFYSMWAVIPLPSMARLVVIKMMYVSDADANDSHTGFTNNDLYVMFDTDKRGLGKVIAKRYLKSLPMFIYRNNPLKGIIYDLQLVKELPLKRTVVSSLFNLLIKLSYYFVIIPFLILTILPSKSKAKQNGTELLILLGSFFIVGGLYSIRFGTVQDRIIWTIIPAFLLAIPQSNYKINVKTYYQIVILMMFPLAIFYFGVKPY